MALIDTVGAANRGYAQGAVDFNTFMQSTANVNQLLANDKQRELMMQVQPAGLTVPEANIAQITAPAAPALQGAGVGLLPQTGIRPAWTQPPAGGWGAPVPGVAPFTNPYTQGSAVQLKGGPGVQPPGNGRWTDYYPNVDVFGVSPNNNMLQNSAAKLGNAFYNLPGNVANISANLVEDPIKNLGAYLLQPEGQRIAPSQVSDNLEVGTPVSTTSPGVGVVAPSPTPGFSSPSGTTGTAAGLSAPSSASGAASATAAPSSSREEYFPTEVRNAALQSDASEMGYIQEQLLAKREEITRSVNEQIALAEQQQNQVLAQTRAQIGTLTQYAEAARQAGNVGIMTRYRDQADQLISQATQQTHALEQSALQLRQQARQQYLDNDLQLWTQQAIQAEYEFRNQGDPTRLTQIMAAYGQPIAIEDAGGGKYRIVDITGEGQGKRRKGTFTSQEIGDMFMSTLSEQFRAQKIAQQVELQAKQMEHAYDIDKIDAQAAADIKKEMAKAGLEAGNYTVTKDETTGDIMLTPKNLFAGYPIVRYLAVPPEDDGSGVADSRLQIEYVR